MMTIILFIGGTAIVGSLAYLAIRPLIVGHWGRWRRDREQDREMRQRDQRRRTLRDEAALSVLSQLARQEETHQKDAGRKAA